MAASETARLIATLPRAQQLAMAYAPVGVRGSLAAVLALDARLASILRRAREPMLGQLRLAWWREHLRSDRGGWPEGEPLLALLKVWPGPQDRLAALVDGWEAMTAPAPLHAAAIELLADARAAACAALADPRSISAAARMGRNWALMDIAAHLSSREEREVALGLARDADWRGARLPAPLRPLQVLHALAKRNLHSDRLGEAISPADMLAALRAGAFGR